MFEYLLKSRVKGHTRRLKSGKVVNVQEHHDRRTKKTPVKREIVKPFYSRLQKLIEEKMPNRAPADMIRNLLKPEKGLISADEVKWSGIETFLEGKKTVAKDDILAHLRSNEIEVTEVEKRADKGMDVFAVSDGEENKYFDTRLEAEQYATDQGINITEDTVFATRTRIGALEWEQATDHLITAELPNGNTVSIFSDEDKTHFEVQVLTSDAVDVGEPEVFSSMWEAKEAALNHVESKEQAGGTKYAEYTLPGGESYKELLLTLPEKEPASLNEIALDMYGKVFSELGDEEANKVVTTENKELKSITFNSSHWDGKENILSHVRFNERTDAEGNKVLFLEEIQSDWALEGRKHGFKSEGNEQAWQMAKEETKVASKHFREVMEKENFQGFDSINEAMRAIGSSAHDIDSWSKHGLSQVAIDAAKEWKKKKEISAAAAEKLGVNPVPDAPLLKNWHEFTLKRMLRYAAEKGFDKMAWVTGQQTADRYDLSKQINKIDWGKNHDGTYDVSAVTKENKYVTKRKLTSSEIESFVGKDITRKITESASDEGVLEGVDLKIGGKWATTLYDKVIPNYLNKYGKKWGAKVEEAEILVDTFEIKKDSRGQWNIKKDGKTVKSFDSRDIAELYLGKEKVQTGRPQLSIPITKKMKESILYEGQSLFKSQPWLYLFKSEVKGHTRRLKSGRVVPVRAHSTSRTKKAPGIKFRSEMMNHHHGQSDMQMSAFDAKGVRIGYVDYTLFEGDISIRMVEVSKRYRRKGIATRMYKQIIKENPGAGFETFGNFATPEGKALRRTLENSGIIPESRKDREARESLVDLNKRQAKWIAGAVQEAANSGADVERTEKLLNLIADKQTGEDVSDAFKELNGYLKHHNVNDLYDFANEREAIFFSSPALAAIYLEGKHEVYKEDKRNLEIAAKAIVATAKVEKAVSRGGVKTLGVGITAELANKGYIDLRGKEASSAADIAVIAQVYRDPRYETFRYIYTKEGKIVGHEGRTSRMPGMTPSVIGDPAKEISEIKRRIERLEADGVWLVHNHPSGRSKPSSQDIVATDYLIDRIPQIQGHVIINSNEYSTIGVSHLGDLRLTKEPETFKLDEKMDKMIEPSLPHSLLGEHIGGHSDVIRMAKDLQTPNDFINAFYRSSDGKVRGLQEIPVGMAKNKKGLTDYLRGRARQFGASQVVLTANRSDKLTDDMRKNIIEAVQGEAVTDTIFFNKDEPYSVRESVMVRHDPDSWMGQSITTGTVTKAIKAVAAGLLLIKSRVKAHTRKTKSGKVVQVKEHTDSRSKKKPVKKVAKKKVIKRDELDYKSKDYKYKDIGHIPGSRKEQALLQIRSCIRDKRGLQQSDLDWTALEENPKEAYNLINKQNVFGASTFDEMEKRKVDPGAAFLIQKIYGSIAPRPEDSPLSREDYVNGINALKDRMEKVKTVDDVLENLGEIGEEMMGFVLNPEETKEYKKLIRKQKTAWGTYRTLEAEHKILWDAYYGPSRELDRMEYDRAARDKRGWKPNPEIEKKFKALQKKVKKLWDIDSAWRKKYGKKKDAAYKKSGAIQTEIRLFKEVVKRRNVGENILTRGYLALGKKFAGVAMYRRFGGSDSFGKHVASARAGRVKDYSFAKGESKVKKGTKQSARFQLAVADHIERTGGRPIAAETTEELKKHFKLKNVQSGNWVLKDINSAKFHVEQSSMAFQDMADMLKIPDKDISMHNRLSMAFGARGQGLSKASAHYESKYATINLTKMKGGGSLSHEWFHGIDHIVGEIDRGAGGSGTITFTTDTPKSQQSTSVQKAFGDLVEVMTAGKHGQKETINLTDRERDHWKRQLESRTSYGRNKSSAFFVVKDAANLQDAMDKLHGMSKEGKFGTGKKGTTNYGYFRQMAVAQHKGKKGTFIEPGSRGSKYLSSARRIEYLENRKSAYWSSNRELAARAFEGFMEDKLGKSGRKNTYLVGHANNQGQFMPSENGFEQVYPYPEGTERKKINKALDNLFKVIKKEKTLKKAMESIEARGLFLLKKVEA